MARPVVPERASGALNDDLVLNVNHEDQPTDLEGMRKPREHRNETIRQWVRIILLTALILAVETGYVDLHDVPLPDENAVAQTVGTQQENAVPGVVMLDH